MPTPERKEEKPRRRMHRRVIDCDGYLRDDGLWEVEARLVDTKPFPQRDQFRGDMPPGAPVHDIRLRLAVDDSLIIREAETSMVATPYPTCIEVEGILQRLVGVQIGKGFREAVRSRIGRLETCTHLSELLGPGGNHTVPDHVPRQADRRQPFHEQPTQGHRAAVLRQRLPFLAHRRPDRGKAVSAICDQAASGRLVSAPPSPR